jgi:hypothetical protein
MAAPSYVSDLTTIADCDPAASDVFTEPSGATLGTLTQDDLDNYIQGITTNRACTKSTGASGAPALAGIGIAAGAPQTITSPSAFYCWVFVGGAGLIDTYANGGIQLIIGNLISAYRAWKVDGSDFFPYIGWQCIAIETDYTVVAADGTGAGSPTTTKQYFGVQFNCKINIGKGNPMGADALRWGRTITITAGDLANGYATFAGIAAQNDSVANRWGQFQGVAGGYQLQGRLLLGTAGTAVDFRDSNVSIVTAISRKVAASFNAIEIQNAGSRVDWNAVTWTALGTISRGTFTVTNDADVNISNCNFTNLSTFTLGVSTDMLNCVLRQCDTVTCPGSNMTGSQILLSRVAADAGALVWTAAIGVDTDGKLDRMTFSKGTNAHHAIAFGTTTKRTITLRGITFTGFNAANGNTDSALLFPDTGADVTWTVNAVGTSGVVSYKKMRAGDTVNVVANPVTLAVHVQDSVTGDPVKGARVYVTAAAGGDLSVGTVLINATTGDPVYSDATDTRTYTSDQPITGWVRKATAPGPYYKPGPVAGVVDSESGLALTVQMVPDV